MDVDVSGADVAQEKVAYYDAQAVQNGGRKQIDIFDQLRGMLEEIHRHNIGRFDKLELILLHLHQRRDLTGLYSTSSRSESTYSTIDNDFRTLPVEPDSPAKSAHNEATNTFLARRSSCSSDPATSSKERACPEQRAVTWEDRATWHGELPSHLSPQDNERNSSSEEEVTDKLPATLLDDIRTSIKSYASKCNVGNGDAPPVNGNATDRMHALKAEPAQIGCPAKASPPGHVASSSKSFKRKEARQYLSDPLVHYPGPYIQPSAKQQVKKAKATTKISKAVRHYSPSVPRAADPGTKISSSDEEQFHMLVADPYQSSDVKIHANMRSEPAVAAAMATTFGNTQSSVEWTGPAEWGDDQERVRTVDNLDTLENLHALYIIEQSGIPWRKEGRNHTSEQVVRMEPVSPPLSVNDSRDEDINKSDTTENESREQDDVPIHQRSTSRQRSSLKVLRQTHEENLIFDTVGDDPASVKSPESLALGWGFSMLRCALSALGFVPIQLQSSKFLSACFQNSSVLAVATIVIYSAIGISFGDFPFTVGGFLVMVLIRTRHMQSLIAPCPGPLEVYAFQYDFLDICVKRCPSRLVISILLWISIVLTRSVCSWHFHSDCGEQRDTLGLISVAWSSGIFMTLICYQWYAFGMLGVMVDQFCIRFFATPDVSRAVREWNVIQAMLRHITSTFASCFLATQTMALAALLITALRSMQAHSDWLDGNEAAGRDKICAILHLTTVCLPSVFLALGAGCVFFTAAGVTEKCSRVPALINSMVMVDHRTGEIDQQRQYLIQYISNSAAGFYIKEVRLTASMALKLAYVIGLCAFGVLTKIATGA